MIERVKFMAQKGDPKLASAIWEKTQKEVKKGTMGPPLTISQVEQRYGPDFQVTPSFGLEQGVNEAGAPKYRRIDDYTASGVNPSAHRTQKVPMCMVDYIGVMIRAAAQVDTNIHFATEDMASAYRQVPLDPRDVRYAITGVYDPSSGEVWLHEMYMANPLGQGMPYQTSAELQNGLHVVSRGSSICTSIISSMTSSSWNQSELSLPQFIV